MIIDAVLERLELSTPDVAAQAAFYAKVFGFRVEQVGDTARCEGAERSLWWSPGAANRLIASHFRMPDEAALMRHADRLEGAQVACVRGVDAGRPSLRLIDPDGRALHFSVGLRKPVHLPAERSARLQHYAVRTPDPQRLVDFYVGRLGFTPSDMVRDGAGDLGAAFLRTDHEHHALAIFRAAEPRFDHVSFETSDWTALRDWADHAAAESAPLAWGVGRHGPGNDTFFMVMDPDGNLAEISSDLERCAPDRPVGLWPHRPETLNRWGVAIMRS